MPTKNAARSAAGTRVPVTGWKVAARIAVPAPTEAGENRTRHPPREHEHPDGVTATSRHDTSGARTRDPRGDDVSLARSPGARAADYGVPAGAAGDLV